MTDAIIKDYTRKITQANPSELIVILYELLDLSLQEAKEYLKNNQISEFDKSMKRASSFLNEIMGSLDYSYPIAHELIRLYQYVNKEIVLAYVEKQEASIDHAFVVLDRLKQAFTEIVSNDTREAVMGNTQQLYAGLTYGKGTLNETILNDNNRGFKA